MKLWTHDSFEIETKLTREIVVERLRNKVEKDKLLRPSQEHNYFQGKVTTDGFLIKRIIHYRNSFIPIINGKFIGNNSDIKVAIRMGLNPFVAAFMFFWLGGAGLGILGVIAGLLTKQTTSVALILIPVGMLLFGWALVSAGFWFEAKRQKIVLVEMFKEMERS